MLTAIAGVTIASHAQEFGFQKGNILLEGNVGLSTSKNGGSVESKTTALNLNPKAGYFFCDKFAVGLDLGYGLRKYKIEPSDFSEGGTSQTDLFRIGAFGRYYFLELGRRFKTYTELGAAYEQTNYDGDEYDYDKSTGYTTGAGIGANFFITPKIAIGYSFANLISYSSRKPDTPDADRVSRFDVNVNSFNNFLNAGSFSLTFKL